ncbi:MAG: Mobile element protein [Pseudonocardiales bacterium]|nr:Mobile element protein [Pseudonocardiales bacterium]
MGATPSIDMSGWLHEQLAQASPDLLRAMVRSGSYFPDWLFERRLRAEAARLSVVATSYLLGVSTRRIACPCRRTAPVSCRRAAVSRW